MCTIQTGFTLQRCVKGLIIIKKNNNYISRLPGVSYILPSDLKFVRFGCNLQSYILSTNLNFVQSIYCFFGRCSLVRQTYFFRDFKIQGRDGSENIA